MKRLWIQLSLMIGGVLFLVFFMQFLSIMFIPDPIPAASAPGQVPAQEIGPHVGVKDPEDPAEITRRLIDFAALSLLVGAAGGIVISRVVSRPISKLAAAAHQIGKGDLGTRVKVEGSQEMIELGDTFNHMAAELQRAEELRVNLMADVSHELRTPLTVLEGNLRAVLDHVYTLDEAEVANLYGQTHHLIRLVNDLRELSLAESNQLAMEKVPTDLNLLLDETLQALEPLAAEKEIRLIRQVEQLPLVSLDPFRIRQVLYNLLSNALRHTPAGGEITLSGESRTGKVRLKVEDSGDGLDAEQIKAVFDRFYRSDKSRSRDTGGSGLGLAIVKAIAAAHGGQVEASSAGKGRGSTFTLTLPVS